MRLVEICSCRSLPWMFVVLMNAITYADETRPVAPDAENMMRTAHAARALWHGFPGFTADITVSTNGVVAEGRLTVSGAGALRLDDLDSGNVPWAVRRLQSLVDHRMPQEARDYDVSFADEVTAHPLGRLIRIHEDRFHSLYRIAGDVITEVHRTMGTTRFSITVTETHRNLEGKHLPEAYSVSWWNIESGTLTACDVVRNEWVRIGGFDLSSRLLSVRSDDAGQRDVREIRLRHHKLLQKGVSERTR